jgi:hypothetical protein
MHSAGFQIYFGTQASNEIQVDIKLKALCSWTKQYHRCVLSSNPIWPVQEGGLIERHKNINLLSPHTKVLPLGHVCMCGEKGCMKTETALTSG